LHKGASRTNARIEKAGQNCSRGGRFSKTALTVEDPVIVDRGTSTNKKRCEEVAKARETVSDVPPPCDYEASPEPICLDASYGPDGSGPDVGSPTGGTIVTVGVGSGDYYLEPEGVGGEGGFSADSSDDDSP
jgi:hypothetical protein